MSNRSMRNRWSCGPAVVAVILGLLVAPSRSYGQQLASHTATHVGVIPDTHGAIAEILLQYDPDIHFELEPVYRDLFAALPNDVQLKVLCSTAAAVEDFARAWKSVLQERTVEVINVGLPISLWARDRCIARQSLDLNDTGATFVPVAPWDYEPEKSNDLLLQDILHEARLAPAVMDSPLHIEGGNIISNRRHVFFGANVLSENGNLSARRLESELTRLLGRPYLSVGSDSGEAPWCHIDMYFTPVSDDTVLVANPRLASKILSTHYGCDEDGDYWDELPGTTCPSEWLQDQFDNVAALAQRGGYKVYRVPAIANMPDQWMITYNNILLDERNGRKVVYMPVYAIPPLDQVATAIYQGLGFEVRTVDVSQVYNRGGALRCIANVIRRRQPGDTPTPGPADGRMRFVNLAGTKAFDGILDRCRHRLARRSHPNAWNHESWP